MIPFVILAIEDDEDRAFMTEVYLQYERLMWSEIRKLLKMESRNMVNYIISTVKNACLDVLRQQKKVILDSINDEEWGGRYALQYDDDLEATVYRREAVSQLESIWPLLDERSRYLLEGKYFLGLTTREMGAVLNITHDSVRVELSRARKKARKLLEEQGSVIEI